MTEKFQGLEEEEIARKQFFPEYGSRSESTEISNLHYIEGNIYYKIYKTSIGQYSVSKNTVKNGNLLIEAIAWGVNLTVAELCMLGLTQTKQDKYSYFHHPYLLVPVTAMRFQSFIIFLHKQTLVKGKQ